MSCSYSAADVYVSLQVTGCQMIPVSIINVTRLLFTFDCAHRSVFASSLKSCQYAKGNNAAPTLVLESLQLPTSRWSSAQFEHYLSSTVYLVPYTIINIVTHYTVNYYSFPEFLVLLLLLIFSFHMSNFVFVAYYVTHI